MSRRNRATRSGTAILHRFGLSRHQAKQTSCARKRAHHVHFSRQSHDRKREAQDHANETVSGATRAPAPTLDLQGQHRPRYVGRQPAERQRFIRPHLAAVGHHGRRRTWEFQYDRRAGGDVQADDPRSQRRCQRHRRPRSQRQDHNQRGEHDGHNHRRQSARSRLPGAQRHGVDLEAHNPGRTRLRKGRGF